MKKLKVVVFGSGGEAMTALLGGHVGLVVDAVGESRFAHLQAGRMRVLAVAAPQRLEGALVGGADVERAGRRRRRRELAADHRAEGARRAADRLLGRRVRRSSSQTDEWKNEVARDGVASPISWAAASSPPISTRSTRRFKSMLTDLGLAK